MSKSQTQSHWRLLQQHYERVKDQSAQEFAENWGLNWMQDLSQGELHLDLSRHLLDQSVLDTLLDLAKDKKLASQIEALFSDDCINLTESRPALHTAVRADHDGGWQYQGEKLWPVIETTRQKMRKIADAIRSHKWLGASGKPIKHLVNVGIGGSDFGPRLLMEALEPTQVIVQVHFMANLDRSQSRKLLNTLNPEETIFLFTSKSFKTEETLANAQFCQQWLASNLAQFPDYPQKHILAVTSNLEAAAKMGVPEHNCLPVWDWVGGRYSVWSAVGLSVMIGLGAEQFDELLQGAREMDQHFRSTPFEKNLPVMMALMAVWYRNGWNMSAHLVAAYEDRLASLTTYLQQLDMESNGKRVALNGELVSEQTAPVLWGGVGTPVQHTFFQAVHQGTQAMPVDFIMAKSNDQDDSETRQRLTANMLAQASAMFWGQAKSEIKSELIEQGMSDNEADLLAAHKEMPGRRPSSLLWMNQISAKNIGALLALYEHRTYVQSVLWGINAYDQWGVELGKKIANRILPHLSGEGSKSELDPLTQRSIDTY